MLAQNWCAGVCDSHYQNVCDVRAIENPRTLTVCFTVYIYIFGQWALSSCCLLLLWFKLVYWHLGRATSRVYIFDFYPRPARLRATVLIYKYILYFGQQRNMFHIVNQKLRIFIRKLLEKNNTLVYLVSLIQKPINYRTSKVNLFKGRFKS